MDAPGEVPTMRFLPFNDEYLAANAAHPDAAPAEPLDEPAGVDAPVPDDPVSDDPVALPLVMAALLLAAAVLPAPLPVAAALPVLLLAAALPLLPQALTTSSRPTPAPRADLVMSFMRILSLMDNKIYIATMTLV